MEIHNLELKCLLRRNIAYLRDNLVYEYLKVALIGAGILTETVRKDIENQLDCQRIENIILHLIDSSPQKIPDFLEVLKDKRNGYVFVYDYLNQELSESDKPRDVKIHKTEMSERKREINVSYRHILMRLSHENQVLQLQQLQQCAIVQWNDGILQPMSARRKMDLADQFIMAIDSEIEYKRIKSDKELLQSGLFEKLMTAIPFTENPARLTMLYLARFGSAMSLAGESYQCSLSYVEQAIQQSQGVYPGRETGMVHYIYFNMLSSEYEQNPTRTLKRKLLDIAKKTIDHFAMENNEQVNCDYRRFVLIKIAMIHLGIGIFGDFIPNTDVDFDDLRSSKDCLQEIENPDMWSRMEVRRKMFFNTVKSKVRFVENDVTGALNFVESAKMFALDGNYDREKKIIEEKTASLKKLQEHELHTIP